MCLNIMVIIHDVTDFEVDRMIENTKDQYVKISFFGDYEIWFTFTDFSFIY